MQESSPGASQGPWLCPPSRQVPDPALSADQRTSLLVTMSEYQRSDLVAYICGRTPGIFDLAAAERYPGLFAEAAALEPAVESPSAEAGL